MKTPRRAPLAALVLALMLAPAGALAQDEPAEPPADEAADEAGAEAATPQAPAAAEPAEETADEAPVEAGPVAAAEITPAPADQPVYVDGGLFELGLVVAPKLGAGFSQVFGGMGTSFNGELEIGYLLPFLDRSFEVFVTGAYAAPGADSTDEGPDVRLPEPGTFSYDMTMQQLVLGAGVLYRIPVGGQLWRPYLAAGAKAYLWEAEITGESGGEDFGTYTESATDWGGFATLGADVFVGPGSVLVEVQANVAPVDGTLVRDTNAGALSALLGYRFFL